MCICRFWKVLGIQFESEGAERKARDEVIGAEVMKEMIPLLHKDLDQPDANEDNLVERDTPLGYLKNIPSYVSLLLDNYGR